MPENLLLPLLLIIASVLGAGMIVPQVVRLHSRRTAAGVSPVGAGVGIALNLWWVIYALQTGIVGILPVSIVAIFLYAAIAQQLLAIVGRSTAPAMLLGAISLGSLPLPFLLLGSWEAAGYAIGLAYAVQFIPAAVAATRSEAVDGVSPLTWAMALVEAAIWFVYGIAIADPALLVGGMGGAAMATIILFQIATASTRTRRRAAVPA